MSDDQNLNDFQASSSFACADKKPYSFQDSFEEQVDKICPEYPLLNPPSIARNAVQNAKQVSKTSVKIKEAKDNRENQRGLT